MKSQSSVRVRFAPSPTGHLHIGSLRTALFNWLFAKHHKGTFLVRVEDTDRKRSTKEFEESILQSLDWVGIQPDEPMVYQYSRAEIHAEVVEKLLQEGKAYKCFSSEQELAQKKDLALQAGHTYQYDKTWRDRQPTEEDLKKPFVIRFRVDIPTKEFTFTDQIKGKVTIPSDQIDDFVLLRSDGTATYNLAVVQDDYDMKVSHVIRGEDHLINTAKQILLYEALGYALPIFAHIPLILGQLGQKLSKREAATSVVQYKQEGFLAQALCNYLVRLGWSYKDQEIFTAEEMITLFSLDDVQKSGAKFDLEKLKWVNNHYIKELSASDIITILQRDMQKDLLQDVAEWSTDTVQSWIDLYKDRVDTLDQLYNYITEAYHLPKAYDWDSLYKIIAKESVVILQLLQQEFENLDFTKENISKVLKDFCKSHEYKKAHIAQLLRFSLLGTVSGPSVFDMMILFGRTEVKKRISHVISLL